MTTDANNKMNQSDFELIARDLCQARENVNREVADLFWFCFWLVEEVTQVLLAYHRAK